MINSYYSRTTLAQQPTDYTTQVGTGLSESVPFNGEGGCNQIGGYDKINQSINDILVTPLGTRFMRPDYGSNLYTLLYMECDRTNSVLAQNYIKEALDKWEHRVKFLDISVIPLPDYNTLYINITYKLNEVDGGNGKYTFFYDLERGYV